MKCNFFTASEVTLLAFVAAQFGTLVSAAPVSDLEQRSIFERQSCVSRVNLGDARTFALLAKAGITNSGTPLSITGNIGVTPAGAIVGVPTTGAVSGTIHTNTATAASAHAVAVNICDCALAKPATSTISGALGGVTFAPGVYKVEAASSAAADTVITLDGNTDKNGQWIFQLTGALTTGANVEVRLVNGAKACNVYWIVGTASVNAATTLGANNFFKGHICAYGAITAGAVMDSRGSWFVLPATPIITIAGGTFVTEGTCANT
jgi:hypothetical protein